MTLVLIPSTTVHNFHDKIRALKMLGFYRSENCSVLGVFLNENEQCNTIHVFPIENYKGVETDILKVWKKKNILDFMKESIMFFQISHLSQLCGKIIFV